MNHTLQLVKRNWLAILITLISISSAIILFIVLVRNVPWHTDEFIAFRRISCLSGPQNVIELREGCAAWPISLGPFSWNNAYAYVGAASSWIFLPFWILFHQLWATYVYGFLALALIVLGIAKSFNLRSLASIALLAGFFPLAFTVLHDGGPVRVSLVVMAWTPLILKKFLDSRRRLIQIVAVIATALLFLVATEDKPFFLYLVPGAAVYAISGYLVFTNTAVQSLRSKLPGIALFFSGAIAPSIVFLFAANIGGTSYINFLRSLSPAKSIEALAASFQRAYQSIFDWTSWFSRVFSPPTDPLRLSIYNFLTIFIVTMFAATLALITYLSVRRLGIGRFVLLVVSSVLLFAGAVLSGGWTSHHFVFFMIPIITLILIQFETSSTPRRLWIALLLVACSLATAQTARLSSVNRFASLEIGKVMELAANRASELQNAIVNCASWGCNYTGSLQYADDVPWVTQSFERPDEVAQIEEIAKSSHAVILTICALPECTLPTVQAMYPRSSVTELPAGTETWKLFEVTPLG